VRSRVERAAGVRSGGIGRRHSLSVNHLRLASKRDIEMGRGAVAPRGIMPGLEKDIFWKLAGWTFVIYAGAVTTVFAFGIEPSLLG
jgi:hypothetical protein